MIKRKELEALISAASKAAHVARNKGSHIVSPEAIECVDVLRYLRTLPLNATRINETNAFRAVLFLSKNCNPKIRSESRSVVDHWRSILQNKTH